MSFQNCQLGPSAKWQFSRKPFSSTGIIQTPQTRVPFCGEHCFCYMYPLFGMMVYTNPTKCNLALDICACMAPAGSRGRASFAARVLLHLISASIVHWLLLLGSTLEICPLFLGLRKKQVVLLLHFSRCFVDKAESGLHIDPKPCFHARVFFFLNLSVSMHLVSIWLQLVCSRSLSGKLNISLRSEGFLLDAPGLLHFCWSFYSQLSLRRLGGQASILQDHRGRPCVNSFATYAPLSLNLFVRPIFPRKGALWFTK